ncbi:MAG: NAD-dependent epimerase/dehydratase family protein [Chloroflexi bacterium]|nr:NAD-dependent epimerase/dehydratase family protein [Chloroflexota bacterium]MBP8057239.1 NAD-dependent epimerase/dehydratase family protein [Chloroflexota bacterium]
MKAFVTGGTGFIGRHVIRKLLTRGYEVVALVRSKESAAALQMPGVLLIEGDITNKASMRAGMQGSDVVFHIAGWYKIGARDWMEAETINVGGTRNVLSLAHELGVPKIIYTSTVAVFGDTHGELVDETYEGSGPFLSEYNRTKWLAHYKVALPLMQRGAPIIIVMPGGVYGPEDTSIIADMMFRFNKGQLPVVPGADTLLTYAHVEDIAEGHILAAEKGKIGESYILAGPAIPLGEMIDYWADLLGRRRPPHISSTYVRPLAPVVGTLNHALGLSAFYSEETIRNLGAAQLGRADKARAQLGWKTRPLDAGMRETLTWAGQMSQAQPLVLNEQQKQVAKIALIAAAVLFILWLFGRKRRNTE